jgi:hypothetical protein
VYVFWKQYPLNKTFLEDLEEEHKAGPKGRVGVAFKKVAPFFRMFSTYLGSYDQVRMRLCS